MKFVCRNSVGSKEGESGALGSGRAQSEGPGGIIHSVQILTGTWKNLQSEEFGYQILKIFNVPSILNSKISLSS